MTNDGQLTVLIVDDNFDLISNQERILEKAGYKIITAFGGKEGLHYAQTYLPDIVLLDIEMPDLSGFEVLKALKENTSTKDIFVVLITGFLKETDNQLEGLQIGADAYLIRPLPTRLFLAQIKVFANHLNALNEVKRASGKLKLIIEQNPDPILVVDNEGIIIFANKAAETTFNRSNTLIGREFGFPIVSDESTEINILTGNNEVKLAELRITEIDYDGKKTFLATIRDLTKHINYQHELEKMNRLYKVLSAINQGIFSISNKEDLITTAANIFLNVAKFEIVTVFSGPFDADSLNKEVLHFANSSFSGKFEELDIFFTEPMTKKVLLREKKGLIFNNLHNPMFAIQNLFSMGLFPVVVNGKVRFVFQFFSSDRNFFDKAEIDLITETCDDIAFVVTYLESEALRKVEEEQLNTQKELFEIIVNNIPVMIVNYNSYNHITLINNEFEKKTGYSQEYIDGHNLLEAVYPDPEYRAHANDYMMKAEIGWEEFKVTKKNGEILASIWSNIKVRGGNYIGIGIDLTDKKLLESTISYARDKAEELSRVKVNLLANMSHELRTPMIGILGYAEIMEEVVEDPAILEMVEIINKSAQRLIETLNLILDYSRLEAESQEFQFLPFDIVSLTNDVINLFKKSAAKKGLNIHLATEENKITLSSDERAVYQILNNLVNNAIKFTLAGEIKIFIRKVNENNKHIINLKVQDSGIGIKPENLSMIWQEFRQVSEGVGRNFEGTGLGLSVTKKLCDKLGIKLSVSSKIGVGTIFSLNIPMDRNYDLNEYNKSKENNYLNESEFVQKRILYVEDDKEAFGYIKRIIKPDNYIVNAKNSTEALSLLEKEDFDILLMDINLRDGLDGVELTKLIRKNPKFSIIPILAITAYAMPGDREIFLSEGCSDYISKPFRKNDFLSVLKKYL
jgi:PAS domain S-box-containing protein